MVLAKVLKHEKIKDDTRGGIEYEVFDIEVRLGMKRWVIKRKYAAFCDLDKLLRKNFEAECMKSGLLGLPPEAGGKESLLVKEFLEACIGSNELLETAPVRQFLQVPASRALFDLSNDPTRSIFSVSIKTLFKQLPPEVPHSITLCDIILLTTVAISFVPLMIGLPAQLQPFMASLALVVSVWYLSQKEGLFDLLMEKIWGHELVPYVRSMIRPADAPGFWMFIGMMVGFGLGGHRHGGMLFASAILAARLVVPVALVNFAFMQAVANGKIKLH